MANKDFNMQDLLIDQSRFDFRNPERYSYKSLPGLNEKIIHEISEQKNEPKWMTQLRLKSLKIFQSWKDPQFGVDLDDLDLSKIVAYIKPNAKRSNNWDEVP